METPYVGIRPFEKDDWPVFFGRESLLDELLFRLETNRFVAVVGSSGSGKSSVVKAGLLPLLQDHKVMRRAEEWITVICRPGDDPCGSLARRLVEADRRMKGNSDTKQMSVAADLMRAILRRSDRGIIPVLEGFDLPATTHVLIVVDQFEELFGFREAAASDPKAPEEAERFVTCILDSSKEPIQPISSNLPPSLAQRIWVVLTMRSDFIGHCEVFPALSTKVSESQFLVPVLDPEQKREAIVRPSLVTEIGAANYDHFTFDDGLVSIIVNESGTRIDQLPLMQHALMRTWTVAARRAKDENARVPHLTEKDYDSIGRINKALSKHADAAFAEITNDDRDGRKAAITRRLFLLLCDVSPEGKITRRRPTVDEVMKVAQASLDEVKTIVEAFQRDNRNFIVVRPTGEFTPNTRLDVSHEALLRQWGMLNSSEASALEAPVAPEACVKKAQPNRVWSSLKKWLLIQTGQQRNSDMARAARGWLAEERDAATELMRLREDCELQAQGRGDLLNTVALARVKEWQECNRPSEAWAQRYLRGKGTWRAIEEFISESKAEVTMARRVARVTLIGAVASLAIVAVIAIDRASTAEAYAKKATELRKGLDRRRDEQLKLAQKKLNEPTAGKVDAMRHYVNALRADRSSVEAARFVGRSLAEDSWLCPLTPNIAAPAGTSLLCAGIGPDKRIYAVSRSGSLVVWRNGEPVFTEAQSLLPPQFLRDANSLSASNQLKQDPVAGNAIPTPTGQLFQEAPARHGINLQSRSGDINLNPEFAKIEPRIAFQSASFSGNGTHIVVLHAPDSNRDQNQTCQVWKWSGEKYDPIAVCDIPDRSTSYNVTWLPGGQGFMLSRRDAPNWSLYRLESGAYVYKNLGSKDFYASTSIQAAGFSPDGKLIASVMVDHRNEIAMFDSVTGTPVPEKNVRLAKRLPDKINQISFGPGPNELTAFSRGSLPYVIDLLTGNPSRVLGMNIGDQVMRTVMSPPDSSGTRCMALIAADRIHVYSEHDLANRIGEPIRFKGPVGCASFDHDGLRLLTWSGNWGSFSAVRLWSLEAVAAAEWKDENFKEPDVAPSWLPDLAEAVSGHGGSSDEDGDPYPERRTLEDFAATYKSESIPIQYKPLWDRFFDSTGRPKRGRIVDALTASARPPREHLR